MTQDARTHVLFPLEFHGKGDSEVPALLSSSPEKEVSKEKRPRDAHCPEAQCPGTMRHRRRSDSDSNIARHAPAQPMRIVQAPTTLKTGQQRRRGEKADGARLGVAIVSLVSRRVESEGESGVELFVCTCMHTVQHLLKWVRKRCARG